MKMYRHTLFNGILGGLIAATFLSGCQAPIGMNRVGVERAYQQIQATALTGPQLSADTQTVLVRSGVTTLQQQNDPDAVVLRLQERACKDSRRDVLFALAEFSYATAKNYERYTWVTVKQPESATTVSLPGKKAARAYYLASALYSYFYLLGETTAVTLDPFDPHYRTARDFYNLGLAKALMDENGENVNLSSRELRLPMGTVDVTSTRPGFPMPEAQLHEFIFTDEYLVRGLEPRERVAGLGVPLIGIPDRAAIGTNWPSYYLPGAKAPASAFLRVNGTVCDLTSPRLTASLELYSPFNTREVEVGGRRVPLQSDLTAIIADTLEGSVLWKSRMAQFFGGRELIKSGVYLTQPFDPGKIPVVLVYGTAGSPSDWAEAINVLRADPAVSARYQFWFFEYNTGNPIPYSGLLLRNGLDRIVKELDPQGKDPTLRNMVIIGHSQGGLVTKLAVVDSGDEFVKMVSDKPIDQWGLPPVQLELLRDSLIFEHSPYVKTVILACAPNLGSILVNNWIQNLAQRLISTPQRLTQLGKQLATLNLGSKQQAFMKKMRGKIPTSVANMDPNNPFLLYLHDLPLADDIKGHTIIAVRTPGPVEDGNDGVVAYKSAYLPGMESQDVVHCGHGETPRNPVAIDDIRRILLLQLKDRNSPLPEN
jgi:pimeloyl-ACP methyl ester carboxylesterase